MSPESSVLDMIKNENPVVSTEKAGHNKILMIR
jgi:hypothetical protein